MDNLIKQAIAQKHLISFYYQGLYRVAEPHILGICKGSKQILVYQVSGQSKSGILPDWRRLNIHEISRLQMLSEKFPGKRSFPSGKHSSWDFHLAIVD